MKKTFFLVLRSFSEPDFLPKQQQLQAGKIFATKVSTGAEGKK